MPKERIAEVPQTYLEVGWSEGAAQVRIVAPKIVGRVFDDRPMIVENVDFGGPAEIELDESGLTRLIDSLTKARRQAYGVIIQPHDYGASLANGGPKIRVTDDEVQVVTGSTEDNS